MAASNWIPVVPAPGRNAWKGTAAEYTHGTDSAPKVERWTAECTHGGVAFQSKYVKFTLPVDGDWIVLYEPIDKAVPGLRKTGRVELAGDWHATLSSDPSITIISHKTHRDFQLKLQGKWSVDQKVNPSYPSPYVDHCRGLSHLGDARDAEEKLPLYTKYAKNNKPNFFQRVAAMFRTKGSKRREAEKGMLAGTLKNDVKGCLD